MKSNFRKTFVHKSLILFSVAFIFCLTSCSNLFSRGSEDDTEEQTVTFKGIINVDSSFGSDFLSAVEGQDRSAVPNISIGTTYKYYVQATRTKMPDGTDDNNTIVKPSVDAATKSFEVGLQHGTWQIDVSIRYGDTTKTILTDSWITDPPISDENAVFSHEFFLKPYSDATSTGGINLGMTVPETVAKMNVTVRSQPEGAALENSTHNKSENKITYHPADTLPTGQYILLFTFSMSDNTPVFSTEQTINVLSTLVTDRWVGNTSTLIKDGKFELTEQLIKVWRERRTEYYLGGTGASNTNTGGPLDPLATVEHSIALVNDIYYGGTTVKIHMAKGFTDELASRLILDSNKHALIDVWDKAGQTAAPKIIRKSTLGGDMIRIQDDAELTIDGIIIDGGGELSENTGNCGILNSGTFTLKSGNITGNYNSSGDGAGIYNTGVLNLLGGSITGNKMTTAGDLGAGIYNNSLSTINLSGAVTIKDNKNSNNKDSNLYLSSGSKITITGPLEEGTNKTEIYISTENSVTKEHPVTFTNNYGFYGDGYNAGKFPGRYFIGEKATVTYKHATDVSAPAPGDGEAQVAVSSGQIIDPLSDIDVTFSLSKNKFIGGVNTSESLRTIKIIPKYIINSAAPLSGIALEAALAETSWRINMYVGDKAIEGCSWTDPTILIPSTVNYHDTYTLVVRASYKGITFDSELILNDSLPFVQIAPYSWTGSAAEVEALTPTSSVFIAGRTLNIPALIAYDHEVTQGEYATYCKFGGIQPSETSGLGDNYPAYHVSWYDAIVYCNLKTINDPSLGLSHCVYSLNGEKDPTQWDGKQVTDGKYCGPSSDNDDWNGITFDQNADGWRLPTEAEWEFLARDGNLTTTGQTTYSGSNTVGDVAWYDVNSESKSHEVKGKTANNLGLYDMSGNVWEWCWDKSNIVGTDTPADGPESSSSGSNRVTRGGCWYFYASYCTVSSRNYESPSNRNNLQGFRVVRTVTE